MDLPELFARAGIQPEAAADLMTWARARTSALLATIDAKSPLGQSLAPGLAQLVMRHGPPSESIVSSVPPPPPLTPPARTSPSEVPVPRSEKTAAPSSPRATARVISRPFLGAAVEAALQGGEASGNLSPETADAPLPPPSSAQTEADDDASIGGFTRFALNVRRQPAAASERPNEGRATLAHGFALHAEREASQFTDVPAPPSFEASESGVRASLHHITGGDSERSTSLVVGIPDDEGADVPMPRGRGRSGGLSAGASGSSYRPPSGPTQENTLELNLRIEDPELSSALLAMIPANGETSTMLSAAASSALMRATPVVGEPSLQITIDEGSTFVPVAAMTDDDDDDDDETVALRESEPEPPTVIATRRGGRPPPPPPKRGQISAPQPAAAPLAAAPAPEPEPEPTQAKQQRGRGRKKIVELSTPVVRPVARPSTPEPAAPRATREAPRPEHAPIPNYLRDDDE